ncbi:MAG: hypothetical protein H0T63_08370, partial [Pyrinomonadaceae bacterium]|nr:hypothetical protein [Pyrinomonadaceae bacterium]
MTASRKPPSIGQDAPQLEPAVERDESGRVNIKLSRNVRVTVGNRTTGRITITGWDRDTIEAKAVSELGIEYVRASVSTDAAGANVFLKADYAAENILMALFGFRPREVHLEVNLPRHAEIELIKVYRSDVKVTGVDTHIVVSGDRST